MFRSLSSIEAAAILAATEVVADTAAKQNNAVLCYAGYNALAYILQQVLPNNSIAITNAYWNAFTNVTHTVIGVAMFGETLSTAQYTGIALITGGVLLLSQRDVY